MKIKKILEQLFVVVSIVSISYGQSAAKVEPDVLEFADGEKLIGHLVSATGTSVVFHSDAVGDVTVDWSKIKTLNAAGKYAVAQKGQPFNKHTDPASAPQGSISATDKQVEVHEASPVHPADIPTTNVANVISEAEFQRAFAKSKLTQGWGGAASFGLTLVKATQDSRNLTAGVSLSRSVPNVSWMDPRYKTLFDFNIVDGQVSQSGQPTIKTNILHADIEHDVYLSKRMFAFGAGDFLHSFSQGMKLQQTYSGGVGYVVKKDDHQELDVKASIAYINQLFEPTETVATNGTIIYTDVPSKSLIGASFSENYSRKLWNGMALTQGLTVTPAFNDSQAFTANGFANLAIPIHKNFSVTIGTVDSYISEPPAGFQKNSFQFVTQLTYKLP